MMRTRLGLREFPVTYDARINRLALVRNCIVHNHAQANVELAKVSNGVYKPGSHLVITGNVVSRSITIFYCCAELIDQSANAVLDR